MLYDILIPTCKPYSELAVQLCDINKTVPSETRIIVSGYKVSAAVNRNYCLQRASAEYVVMLDDDITGFFPGWADQLIHRIQIARPRMIAMISARLINADGTSATMMAIEPDLSEPTQTVKPGYLPSACIAFKNDGARFDENFEGSSWEDTDFCDTLQKRYPDGLFVIDNSVKLIHANEQKGGNSRQFEINKRYYMSKHPERGVNV